MEIWSITMINMLKEGDSSRSTRRGRINGEKKQCTWICIVKQADREGNMEILSKNQDDEIPAPDLTVSPKPIFELLERPGASSWTLVNPTRLVCWTYWSSSRACGPLMCEAFRPRGWVLGISRRNRRMCYLSALGATAPTQVGGVLTYRLLGRQLIRRTE
jgi:hypothetical protein